MIIDTDLDYLSNFAMHKHGVQEQTSLLQCVAK